MIPSLLQWFYQEREAAMTLWLPENALLFIDSTHLKIMEHLHIINIAECKHVVDVYYCSANDN